MAGSEDLHPHEKPDAPKASPTTAPTPVPTQSQAAAEESLPIKKTGEIMLGFALAIIFLVILCIIIHLLLKHHRQKYPNGKRKKKKKSKPKDLEKGTVELHSVDKKVYEAAGTQVILCELPEDAPPRQELDAGDVFPISPLERTYTGTTGVSRMSTEDWPLTPDIVISPADQLPPEPPAPRRLATYWQTR
jgi:Na+-transporting methylmalonyl-CoA/oxaloacetate decarboxylase gamma subunit